MSLPRIPLSLSDDQLGAIVAAAAPLPLEYRSEFLADAARALALVGKRDPVRLLDRIARAHKAQALLERPCYGGDCSERWQGV